MMKTKIKLMMQTMHIKMEKENMRRETAIALDFPTIAIDTRIEMYKNFIKELSLLIQ